MAMRRKYRKNSPMPVWFWPALVASGISALYFFKKANPGVSLNPTPTAPPAT